MVPLFISLAIEFGDVGGRSHLIIQFQRNKFTLSVSENVVLLGGDYHSSIVEDVAVLDQRCTPAPRYSAMTSFFRHGPGLSAESVQGHVIFFISPRAATHKRPLP